MDRGGGGVVIRSDLSCEDRGWGGGVVIRLVLCGVEMGGGGGGSSDQTGLVWIGDVGGGGRGVVIRLVLCG